MIGLDRDWEMAQISQTWVRWYTLDVYKFARSHVAMGSRCLAVVLDAAGAGYSCAGLDGVVNSSPDVRDDS